jgi:uncharacterized repeat protein (TIGR01451 family)
VTLIVNTTAPGSSIITNTANATAIEPEVTTANNSAVATTNVITNDTDLAIANIDTPDPILGGGQISYTITVTNNGILAADGIQVADAIPAGTTYVDATVSQGTVLFDGTTVTASLGTIGGGGTAQLNLIVLAGGPLLTPMVTNTATVTATTADPNSANNTATATTTVSGPNLTLTKTGTPNQVLPGSNITYTITLSNTGDLAAADVSLNELVPANTTFVSFTAPAGWTASTPPSGGPGTVSATSATLAAGTSAVFTFVVQVSLATPPGTVVTNTATATTSSTEVVVADNSANESTAVAATVAGVPTLDARGLMMLVAAVVAIALGILKRT